VCCSVCRWDTLCRRVQQLVRRRAKRRNWRELRCHQPQHAARKLLLHRSFAFRLWISKLNTRVEANSSVMILKQQTITATNHYSFVYPMFVLSHGIYACILIPFHPDHEVPWSLALAIPTRTYFMLRKISARKTSREQLIRFQQYHYCGHDTILMEDFCKHKTNI
jgi:predicted LPLAT superfamily acyltransferase